MSKVRIRDTFWLWGHPVNACRNDIKPLRDMLVTPAECARYFGFPNVFYVPFGHEMDIEEYSKDLVGIEKSGISIEFWKDPAGNRMDETFKIASLFKNINRLVFDDFFNEASLHNSTWGDYSIGQLLEIRERIHAAGLEMWVVLYQHQLDLEIQEYLDVFDGVSFWFWSEPTKEEYHKYSKLFMDKTVGKRRLIGCYLYDFGRNQEATPDLVRYQLDQNKILIHNGEIEGVILHNNNFGDLGFSAYEEAKLWMDEHGDELV